MTEELENELYLPTDTKIFALVEIEDFTQQVKFTLIQPTWNKYGYELKKSIIPSDNKFKDGTFDFRIEFTSDINLSDRAYYYGAVSALKKGRALDKPFLIISCDSKLRKPIPKSFVEQVEKFHTLSIRNIAKDGIIVTPQAAREIVKYITDSNTVIDKTFSILVRDLTSMLNANVIEPQPNYTEK